MGDLPRARVTPSRPFQFTGVDYAGPVILRTTKGRGHRARKAFIAVFVCLNTCAVHLEVASDYTAEAFLGALRRFVSRRDLCQEMYSDCGTNFAGADSRLRAFFTAGSSEAWQIQIHTAKERIKWKFNPPSAPHFGGLWEAAVKSAKHHIRRVLGESMLTFEEMSTFLAQVEACLNSLPLQALTDDPEDVTALTPGHFLIGSAVNAIPEPSLIDVASNRLSRWQYLQQMRDHFWERWSREYLTTLLHRPKWWKTGEEMTVGRLCLIRSDNTPPTRWSLARVIAVHPGTDGIVRVVTLRTASTMLKRSVTKLVPLPVCSSGENRT